MVAAFENRLPTASVHLKKKAIFKAQKKAYKRTHHFKK
jgi:hypothetical protein